MTLTREERLTFLRVLAYLARTHWDSDIASLARALLRKNQQALPQDVVTAER